MKIMISQPMRGRSNDRIRLEREELTKKLQEQGHYVVDTIFTGEASKDCNEGLYYLAKSIETISKIDAVVFMQGWENARGCRIEEQCAREYGKFVMYL